MIMAPIADCLVVERVVACVLCLGAGCMLLFSTLALPYAELSLVIGGEVLALVGDSMASTLYPVPSIQPRSARQAQVGHSA